MSPTSYQLLYSAISVLMLIYYTLSAQKVNSFFKKIKIFFAYAEKEPLHIRFFMLSYLIICKMHIKYSILTILFIAD